MQDNVKVINLKFEDIKQPVTSVNKGEKKYVKYGQKNDYPIYILDMFDKSGKHGAIVRGKADFIMGNGFAFIEGGSDTETQNFIDNCNADGESLEEVASKVALDVETFGGGYFQVLYNKKKTVSEIYHLDYSKVRTSESLDKFYYSDNWHNYMADGKYYENTKAEIEEIDAFNASKPGGKQIFFVKEYTPGDNTYPKPNYFQALRYIMIDIKIGEYHLNGITNGMFASKLINFNNGVPSPDDQKAIEKKVNSKFAGSENAGKIMLSFNKSGENAPTVLDLSGTDLDKHFDLLEKTTETQIFSSHRVTSPALFGIKTDSFFSSNDELRDAFELFQNTYCSKKRKLIEKAINTILKPNNLQEIYIQKGEPVGVQFSEATIAKVLTEDEIRETLGKKPKAQESATTPADPTPANFNDDLDDEKDAAVFAAFGESRGNYDVIESRRGDYENDFQFHNHYFATVQTLTNQQRKIIDLIAETPAITPEAIAENLQVSKTVVNGILKALEADGLIKVQTQGTETKRTPTADARDIIGNGGKETTSLKIMYSYEGIKDGKNRPFCKRVLELDRLYSRQDIEDISAQLGYSVWHRRGGWYRPPGSKEARPYCRHYWQTNTVISKTKS